jgi:hypothetical protein
MSTLAIRQGRPEGGSETFHVVHRRHDLSGTDYESLTRVDRTLALALVRSGVVVRERDAASGRGRPGIVIDIADRDRFSGEVRADVADPTTGLGRFTLDDAISGEVLGDMVLARMHWVGSPPGE